MFEYEKESDFSQKLEKNTAANYIQKFKDKLTFTKKTKSAQEDYDNKIITQLSLIFALVTFSIPALTFFSLTPSDIHTFKRVATSIMVGLGSFLLLTVLTHVGIATVRKFSLFKNFNISGLFKTSGHLRQEHMNQKIELFNMLKDPLLQKELILYLKKLTIIENEYYEDSNSIEYDMNNLIHMFAQSEYKSAKDLIESQMNSWEEMEKIPDEDKIEEDTTTKFLKSINVSLDDSNTNEYNLKTML